MQNVVLNDVLDNQYAEAKKRFAKGNHSTEDLVIIMLKHQSTIIEHMDEKTHSLIQELESSLKSELVNLDGKIQNVKDSVEARLDNLNQRVDALNQSLNSQTWKMLLVMGLMTSCFTFIVKFQ